MKYLLLRASGDWEFHVGDRRVEVLVKVDLTETFRRRLVKLHELVKESWFASIDRSVTMPNALHSMVFEGFLEVYGNAFMSAFDFDEVNESCVCDKEPNNGEIGEMVDIETPLMHVKPDGRISWSFYLWKGETQLETKAVDVLKLYDSETIIGLEPDELAKAQNLVIAATNTGSVPDDDAMRRLAEKLGLKLEYRLVHDAAKRRREDEPKEPCGGCDYCPNCDV